MNTDTYIRMCEMAEEVQKEWRPKDMDLFCYTRSREIGEALIDNKKRTQGEYTENLKHQFWLPALEQLWEKIERYLFNKKYYFNIITNWYNKKYSFQVFKLINDSENKYEEICEIEGKNIKECVLRVLMLIKYHKSWTGEKWEANK